MTDRKFKKQFGRHPFIIHGDLLLKDSAFPSHTHGSNDKDSPEFMIVYSNMQSPTLFRVQTYTNHEANQGHIFETHHHLKY